MKELSATLMLRPLNFETLATHLYGEAARGTYEEAALAALAIVCAIIAEALSVPEAEAPAALANWARGAGLPGLIAQGLDPAQHHAVAVAVMQSSSYKGNPVALAVADLEQVLAAAG